MKKKEKLPRTQEEQDELYLKTWDYDPSEEELEALYGKDFEKWLLEDELE